MRKTDWLRLPLGALVLAGTPAMADAVAVDAAPEEFAEVVADEGGSGDIVVTARRRAESAQDVPIALAILDSATIESTGTFNIARLTQLQPSVQFITSNPRNSAINIRGIGAPFGLTNDGIEQGVGLYIDQVFYGRVAAATLDFVDIAQIEILRGPQGTLYGKNTTAGALNIATRKPSFSLEGSGEISVGNLDFIQAKASVSGPLSGDKVAARISTSFTTRKGTLYNTNSRTDVNELDNIGVRGQLLWVPNDAVEITVSADYNRQNPEGFAQNYVKVVPTQRAANRQFANLAALSGYTPASTNPFDRLVDNDSELNARQLIAGASLVAEWDLGPVALTSITAWRKWDWYPSNDRDFTGLPVTTRSENPSKQRQWSQELRIASDGGNRLDYVAGAFFYHQTIHTDGLQEQGASASLWLLGPTNGANPALLNGLRSSNDIDYSNDSLAGFGKVTWNLTDRFSLQPGLRINHDRKTGSYVATVTGGLTPVTTAQQTLKNGVLQSQNYSATFSDWNVSGDVTASFKASDDVLLYATYAKSFKSGGINLSGIPTRADGVTPATEVATVRPEKVDHYELGLKSQFLDKAVTFNLSAFQSDIRDYQATVVNGSVGVIRGYLANAEKVRSRGLELDISVRPTDRFKAYAGFAYTDAVYVRFTDAPPPLEQSGGTIQVVDASGGRLPGVSKYALSYGTEYALPAQAFGHQGEYYAGIDGNFRSDFSSSPTPSRFLNVEGFALTNLRAGFRADKGWDVYGWVRNAFGTRYFDFLTAAPGSTGLVVGQLGDPRTYGLTARTSF